MQIGLKDFVPGSQRMELCLSLTKSRTMGCAYHSCGQAGARKDD